MSDLLPIKGYAYLIHKPDRYKIGHSRKPAVRLGQVASRREATLVHAIPSASPRQIEYALQRRFASKHIKGEWFNLDQADVDRICSLGRVDSVEELPPDLIPAPGTKLPTHALKNPAKQISLSLPLYILEEVDYVAQFYHFSRKQIIRMCLHRCLYQLTAEVDEIKRKSGQPTFTPVHTFK